MMIRTDNTRYQEDVSYVAELALPWEKMQNQSVLLSGATGLIGTFFIDVIMYRNRFFNMDCKVIAIGRSEQHMRERFETYLNDEHFDFLICDINKPLPSDNLSDIAYILHLASNTHPMAYATDPIGTIITNIIGTRNMLDFAVEHHAKRMVFASSNEVYGENRGDTEKYTEEYCGYINCNTMRAGYPESKRCGEALCQAYIAQKNIDVVIPRITRSYGPTLLNSDTKALSQFLRKACASENIVLKSDGMQYYSYLYVADTVSGLLTVLLCGKCGEAYNIADESSDIRLKDLAQIVADYAGTEVVFEIPDTFEQSGYSKATKARLNSEKIQRLGWRARYPIASGISRTIDMMRELNV